MNKNELVHEIAKKTDISLINTEKCLNAFVKSVTKSLAKKQNITLVGFGTFQTKERAARNGRNPKTGKTIKIPATTVPNFRAGKALKEAVNG